MNKGIKMQDAQYFNHKALSKSFLSRMDCPAKSRIPFASTPAMFDGTLIHCATLEPEKFDKRYIVAPEINKRTNAGKAEWAEFQEANADKEVITSSQYDTSMNVQKAVYAHPVASELLCGGIAEQAYFWDDPRTGEKCKCKADYVSDVIVDLKSCQSSAPGAFSKSCADFKYHMQHAFYCRGIGLDDFFFIAVEKKAPYVVEVYHLDQEAVDLGNRLIDEAIDKYIFARDFDAWRGYNDPNAITTLSLPVWYVKNA